MTTPKMITDELEMTNVQPLVLAGISAANTQTVQHLVSVARTTPRKLLLIPDADVPVRNVMHLEAGDMLSQDDVDLAALPWETLGHHDPRGNAWGVGQDLVHPRANPWERGQVQ